MLAWTVSRSFLWIMTVLCFIHFELTGLILLGALAVCILWPKTGMLTKLKSAGFILYLYVFTSFAAWFGVALGWFIISNRVQAWRHEAQFNHQLREVSDA